MKILTISYLFAEEIIKSWWVVLFITICSFVYDKASYKQFTEMQKLEQKVSFFNCEIQKNFESQKQLKLYIKNQQKPEVIELVLMKKLGLVPEGYSKICLPSGISNKVNS